MFSQTGRTNGKWTAVSFTLRDKYEPVAGVRRTAAIIPSIFIVAKHSSKQNEPPFFFVLLLYLPRRIYSLS